MEIGDLPISTSHHAKLLAAGYSSLTALSAASPPRLARDLNFEIQEAVDILKIVECANKFKGAEGPSGVLRGGVPGIGKTQLGILLAINVQIPVEYGGLGAKAVYIGCVVEPSHY